MNNKTEKEYLCSANDISKEKRLETYEKDEEVLEQ